MINLNKIDNTNELNIKAVTYDQELEPIELLSCQPRYGEIKPEQLELLDQLIQPIINKGCTSQAWELTFIFALLAASVHRRPSAELFEKYQNRVLDEANLKSFTDVAQDLEIKEQVNEARGAKADRLRKSLRQAKKNGWRTLVELLESELDGAVF